MDPLYGPAARLSLSPENRAAWRIMEQFRDKRKSGGSEKEMGFDKENVALEEIGSFEDIPENDLFFRAARTFGKAIPREAKALLRAAENLTGQVRETHGDVSDFLAGAPLVHREDPYEAKSQRVTLSTLHASKGLEFPVVFIVGLDEGIVPYIRDDEDAPSAALEEERRLLYVGMTRAQSELYLTCSRKRYLFGKHLSGAPSPFLEDISSDLMSFVHEKAKSRKKHENGGHQQQSLF